MNKMRILKSMIPGAIMIFAVRFILGIPLDEIGHIQAFLLGMVGGVIYTLGSYLDE